MLGISIYLGNQSITDQEAYIQNMNRNGFQSIFTSLHIPKIIQPCTRSNSLNWKDRICTGYGTDGGYLPGFLKNSRAQLV